MCWIRLFHPTVLISLSLFIYNIPIFLFYTGMIHSYKISIDKYFFIGGLVRDFFLLFLSLLILVIDSLLQHKGMDHFVKINSRAILKIRFSIKVVTFINCIVLFLLWFVVLKNFGLMAAINGGLDGSLRYQPVIKQCHFLFFTPLYSVACCLFFLPGVNLSKKYLFLNLFCAVSFALLYTARIQVLCALFFSFLVYLRSYFFEAKLSFFKLFASVLAVWIGIIFLAGLRDFDYEGIKYTDSRWGWGLSVTNDYFLSTSCYSSNAFRGDFIQDFRLKTFCPTLTRFFPDGISSSSDYLEQYGDTTYTNTTPWVALRNFGFGGLTVILILYAFWCAFFWRIFLQGSLGGYLFYPVIAYSALEFWRFPYLFDEIAQFIVFYLTLIFVFAKCTLKKE